MSKNRIEMYKKGRHSALKMARQCYIGYLQNGSDDNYYNFCSFLRNAQKFDSMLKGK